MGNNQSNEKKNDEKKQYEKPNDDFSKSKKKQFRHGVDHTLEKLPEIFPNTKCNLRKLRLERLKDLLLIQLNNVERSEAALKEKAALDDQEDAFSQQRQIVEEMRGSYMQTGTLEEMVDDSHAIVTANVGLKYYVNILSFVDRALLDPGCSVLIHSRSHSVVGVLQGSTDPAVSVMKVDRAPLETYADVGGLDQQIQEVKEAVELPLTHPELFDDIGVAPPKGVIFYGPPGTGKTLLAKAVARETAATFLHMVGSELIQKYLGDGPKLVRELFKAAEEFAPSIVFIDEIDAVGSKRYTSNSGGTREVQRTMLELLNQLDGFDSRGEVKVIMATNRVESLDPALLRPGRIDRKIEFGMPDTATKRRIFGIHTAKMTLAPDVSLDEFAAAKGELSGADIKAICTEAGMLALRERRMQVNMEDFKKARETALYRKKAEVPEGLYL